MAENIIKFKKSNAPADVLADASGEVERIVACCVVWIDTDGAVSTRWSCDVLEMAAMTAAMNKYLHEEL